MLRFEDSKGRPLPTLLRLGGLRIDEWCIQEHIYAACDEIRVLDQNLDGAQLEFGRFLVQFVRRGGVVGQHLADSAAAVPTK